MSLNAETAKELVQAIKDAKHKAAMSSSPAPGNHAKHEEAITELRAAEDAYADYLYSQRP